METMDGTQLRKMKHNNENKTGSHHDFKELNLQPVARVGREERAAQHQDAAQHTVLGHLGTDGGSAAFALLGSARLFPVRAGE